MPSAIKISADERPYSLLSVPEDAVDHTTAEAIMWMVNLKSGEATEREHAEFAAWHDADASHRHAWKHLSDSLGPINVASALPLPKGSLARSVIKDAVDRRQVLKGATFGVAVVAAAAMTDRLVPLRSMRADYHTWTAEERQIALPDGGSMTLGPRAAANLETDGGRDRIELLAGDLFINPGVTGRRGIDIAMSDWSLTLPSGRVSLHYNDAQMSAVSLDTRMTAAIAGGAPFEVEARQSLSIENGALVHRQANVPLEESWSRGLLVVDDESLDNLIRSLRPYFVGLIRITPAAKALRIAGVFRLREPRNTLFSLAENFPIKVREMTPFWLSVDVGA